MGVVFELSLTDLGIHSAGHATSDGVNRSCYLQFGDHRLQALVELGLGVGKGSGMFAVSAVDCLYADDYRGDGKGGQLGDEVP